MHLKKFPFVVLVLLATTSLLWAKSEITAKDYTKLVDPMIGTNFHGHTFPGATVPFGMIQLSPDTRTDTWDGCSGYHLFRSKYPGVQSYPLQRDRGRQWSGYPADTNHWQSKT